METGISRQENILVDTIGRNKKQMKYIEEQLVAD